MAKCRILSTAPGRQGKAHRGSDVHAEIGRRRVGGQSEGGEVTRGPAGRERERESDLCRGLRGKWEPGYLRKFKIKQLSFVVCDTGLEASFASAAHCVALGQPYLLWPPFLHLQEEGITIGACQRTNSTLNDRPRVVDATCCIFFADFFSPWGCLLWHCTPFGFFPSDG